MQVILKDNVSKLGRRGQIVDVRSGYARNYLLPKGIAVKATPGALKQLELVRGKIELEEAQKRNEHEVVAEQLAQVELIIEASANEEGHLYGSVTEKEIAEALQQKGFEISPRQIDLQRHVKQVGEHELGVALYHEVSRRIKLYVVGPDGMGMPESETAEDEDSQAASEGEGDSPDEPAPEPAEPSAD